MSIFLIGDLHLNHTNIIKYCHRPFKSIGEMNRVLIDRWNTTVGGQDTVYFLGDLCFGDPQPWLDTLNGDIRFIKGNHDKELCRLRQTKETHVLEHNLESFMLVHAVEYLKGPWNGWVIHGHHHNNQPKEFPLVNRVKKTMNVSAEMLNYYPIELDELLSRR